MSEYEKRLKQDAEASSAWIDTVFPVHLSDADEDVDGVTETDFSPSHAAIVIFAAPTGCLDSDCLTTCDICKFGAGEPEEAEEADLAAVLKDMEAVDALREKSKKGSSFFHRSSREAQFDLYGLASNCRGSRGRAELQFLARMGV